MQITKYVTKKCLRETLLTMSPGDTLEVKCKDFKPNVVRQALIRIHKSDKRRYEMTEAGYPDGCLVTRIG